MIHPARVRRQQKAATEVPRLMQSEITIGTCDLGYRRASIIDRAEYITSDSTAIGPDYCSTGKIPFEPISVTVQIGVYANEFDVRRSELLLDDRCRGVS